MKYETIGLCLIGKNEEKNIERLINSVDGFVDKIFYTDTGSTDDTISTIKAICEEKKIPLDVSIINQETNPEVFSVDYSEKMYRNIIQYEENRFNSYAEWKKEMLRTRPITFDFGKARNFNFAQADTDWIIWLDCDDTLENGEYLRKYIEFAQERNITDIWLTYRYLVEDNKDVTVHSKSRIVRNGLYEWTEKAMIHENMFIKPEFKDKHKSWLPTDESIKVRHWATIEDLKESGLRNISILKTQYEREGDKKDPRTVFLLGRELHAQEQFEEAKKYLLDYIGMVKYGHERVNAITLLFNIAERKNEYAECEKWGFEAIKSDSDQPSGYLLVATSYYFRGFWKKAIDWVEQSLRHKPKLSGGEVQNVQGLKIQSTLILAECYQKLEDYEKAKAILISFLKENPSQEKDIVSDIQNCDIGIAVKKELDSFRILANTALRSNKLETIKTLISILPESLKISKEVLRLKRAVGLFKQWKNNSVVIYCGWNVEEWDANSINKGLGGSETAVVYMASQLQKMGYNVFVYNSVEEKRIIDGVTYIPSKELELADKFNVFISWRNLGIFEKTDVYANLKLLWLHDVPNPRQYTEDVLQKIDKIIVLSEYHRSLLANVPDEKIYISSNGIDSSLIELSTKKRKPKSIIYSSAPDRGLETLVDMLLEINVDNMFITWAYGWESFDVIRQDKESQEWKNRLIEKMNRLGVRQVGRLGKKELYKEYQQHELWVYPTQFQEISCISCMEAQANGCYPISTGFAALKETQIFGEKVELSKIKEVIKERLKTIPQLSDDYKYQSEIAKETFDWNKVAKEWDKDLLMEYKSEKFNPLVSIICITIRPGIFRVLREQVEKQSYKNIELIIVDGIYSQRKDEVREYMKDFKFPYIHIPDPNRDKSKYPYGLFHADNAGLFTSNGELVVFLQDFIEIPIDGIQKYVDLYETNPDKMYSGVDDRWHYEAEELDTKNKLDVFSFKNYKKTKSDYTSPRIRIGGATRRTTEPMEWELNWSASPRKILIDLGGWNNDWDRGFAYDNSEIALRHVYNGGQIIIDETNMANALSHWEMSAGDEFGVPTRDNLPNDNRYATYIRLLQTSKHPKFIMDFEEPKYPNYILREIQEWKNRKD